jgi:ATP-binding cassette subfamily A (ABC1) protein 3
LGKGLLFSTNISAFVLVEGKPLDAWSDTIMGTEIIFLAIESVVYIILAIYIDIWSTRPSIVRYFTRKPVKADPEEAEEEDEDVIEEAERVQRGDANSDKIVLNELTKQYPNGKVAVNGLSIGIPAGQCFGLLGINGAGKLMIDSVVWVHVVKYDILTFHLPTGKTTTMGILTAEFPPTSGDATLATYSVTSQPEETRKRIGYW